MLKEYFEKLYTGDRDTFFAEMGRALENGEKHFIVTANPETLMIGEKNADFDRVLLKDSVTIVPDGIGVVKAAESLGKTMHGRVTGVELSAHLLEEANRLGKSVYLYGAKEEVLAALLQKLSETHPNLKIVGAKNGYDHKRDDVMEDAAKQAPDLMLVALGIPHQELLIDRHFEQFEKGIFIGVGGTFDVLSGTVRRAPRLFVKLNLEWLWRILRQPSRFARFYESNVKFISRVKTIRKETSAKG